MGIYGCSVSNIMTEHKENHMMVDVMVDLSIILQRTERKRPQTMNLSTDNTRIVTVVTAILPQTCNQSTESFVKFLLNSTVKSDNVCSSCITCEKHKIMRSIYP